MSDVGTQAAESAARRRRRSQGRFTRNFVVQGTAAEWALCWMGEIRRRLRSAGMRTELVFFVHDEVVLHGPATEAEAVRTVVAESASAAGRLLFGPAPVTDTGAGPLPSPPVPRHGATVPSSCAGSTRPRTCW